MYIIELCFKELIVFSLQIDRFCSNGPFITKDMNILIDPVSALTTHQIQGSQVFLKLSGKSGF